MILSVRTYKSKSVIYVTVCLYVWYSMRVRNKERNSYSQNKKVLKEGGNPAVVGRLVCIRERESVTMHVQQNKKQKKNSIDKNWCGMSKCFRKRENNNREVGMRRRKCGTTKIKAVVADERIDGVREI